MNDNMKKVLVALRSGLYEQTVEALQDETGFCCLGVMCEIWEKETGEKLVRDNKDYAKLSRLERWRAHLRSYSRFYRGGASGLARIINTLMLPV